MRVKVRLFATFREGREKETLIDSDKNISILDVIDMLKIDIREVSILLLNGRDGSPERQLSDGDVLSLFPPVGGG